MREKEQIQLQLDTRTKELQHLRIEKEQLNTEKEQLSTEKEQLRTEKEQLRTEKEQLRTEKEQLTTEKEQLQAANTRADEQICQLQLQVRDMVTSSMCNSCFIHGYHHTGPTTTAADKSKS